VEAHAVSRQFADDRNLAVVPAALVWNAGASLRLSSRPLVQAALEVKNLLDDRTLLDPLSNPLPGRTVLLSIRFEAPRSQGDPIP
jgi:iron complex outermembrane receptor protein